MQFIDSARFMAGSLSGLVEFIELNVNTNVMIKNVKLVELIVSIATEFFNIQTLKMN